MDKVSIIIPVYNVERYICQCIDSVINQTYHDLEILLIDDGSTDKSYEICKQYEENDSRIVLYHFENSGVSNARNFGMKKVTGKWIIFLDSDDWMELDACEKMVCTAKKNGVSLVMCEAKKAYADTSIENHLFSEKVKLEDSNHLLSELMFTYDTCSTVNMPWAKLHDREWLQSIGATFPLGIHPCEDTVFYFQVFLKSNTNIAIMSDNLWNYRMRKSSSVNRIDARKSNEEKGINIIEDMAKHMGCNRRILDSIQNRKLQWLINYVDIKSKNKNKNQKRLLKIVTKEQFYYDCLHGDVLSCNNTKYYRIARFLLRRKMFTAYIIISKIKSRKVNSQHIYFE